MGKVVVREQEWSRRVIERSHELADLTLAELRDAATSEDLLGGDSARGFKGELTRRFLGRLWKRGYGYVTVVRAPRNILRMPNGKFKEDATAALTVRAERPVGAPAHGLTKTLREFNLGFINSSSTLGAERLEELKIPGALNGRTDAATVLAPHALLIGNFVPEVK